MLPSRWSHLTVPVECFTDISDFAGTRQVFVDYWPCICSLMFSWSYEDWRPASDNSQTLKPPMRWGRESNEKHLRSWQHLWPWPPWCLPLNGSCHDPNSFYKDGLHTINSRGCCSIGRVMRALARHQELVVPSQSVGEWLVSSHPLGATASPSLCTILFPSALQSLQDH